VGMAVDGLLIVLDGACVVQCGAGSLSLRDSCEEWVGSVSAVLAVRTSVVGLDSETSAASRQAGERLSRAE